MSFPKSPGGEMETIFKASGQNLKVTSMNKTPFEVKIGYCELCTKTDGDFTWTIYGNAKRKTFIFKHSKGMTLTTSKREAAFTIVIRIGGVTTQLLGKLDDQAMCDKLINLITNINRYSSNTSGKWLYSKENVMNGWGSKENDVPTKMTGVMDKKTAAVKLNRTPLKGRDDFPVPLLDRQRLPPKNNVRTKIFPSPVKKASSNDLSFNGDDDVKITALGATKSSNSFYGENRNVERSTPVVAKKPEKITFNSTQSSKSSWSFGQRNKLSRFPRESNSSTVVGFSNLGNTCYMNSILQCLLNIPSFFQDLKNADNLELVQHDSLYNSLCNLGILKYSYESVENQRYALKRVKSAISTAAKRFSGYAQHDAHEFLCQCLDQLKEDLLNELKKKCQMIGMDMKDFSEINNFSCAVNSNFESTIVHTIKCQSCEENVKKEEDCHDFSLNIPIFDENTNPADHNIKKLLKTYFGDEIIEYCCEKCQGKYSLLSHHFSRLPRVLILHIKRYDIYDVKRNDRISIPKSINISPHITDETKPIPDFIYNKERLKPHNGSTFGSVSNGVEKRKYGDDIGTEPSLKVRRSSPTDDVGSDSLVKLRTSSPTDNIGSEPSLKLRKSSPSAFPSLNTEMNTVSELEAEHMPSAYCKNTKYEETFSPEGNSQAKCEDADDESAEKDIFDGESVGVADNLNTHKESIPSSPLKKEDGIQGILDDLETENGMKSFTSVSEDEDEEFNKALEISMKEYQQAQMENLRKLRGNTSALNYAVPEDKSFEEEKDSDTDNVYKLVGIVNHHGENTGTGHYTSDSYDFKSKKWRSYNDSSVKEVKEHEVRFGRSHSAYIVFYMHRQCYEAIMNG